VRRADPGCTPEIPSALQADTVGVWPWDYASNVLYIVVWPAWYLCL